ncbi:MAG: histidine--tRNA ligase [Saezia sp.]
MEQVRVISGMKDILPPESATWEWFEEKVRNLMGRYAYRNIRTPILEFTPLFIRGIGEVTDIVEKEMYSFVMGNESLSLRPENTAGVVRAVSAQKSAFLRDGPKRLFYIGPMFRHERPQEGRQRQFHQVGAECIGFVGPDVDAELILMAHRLWKELGVCEHVQLELNSLGQPQERKLHREALIAYFEKHQDVLDEDAKRRLYSNPLRILDTKNPAMQDLVEQAPQLMDYLGEESKAHFDGVTGLLNAYGVEWKLNPRLVRGLDYYNLTVFEFVTDKLGSQATICGGGRYDHLFEMVGAKPSPAVGWAMGVERILSLLSKLDRVPAAPTVDAYAIIQDQSVLKEALPVLEQLRHWGVTVQMHAASETGFAKMKNQFGKANDSGARFALVFGADELASGMLTIKSMQGDEAGQQWQRPLAGVTDWYAELLKYRNI